MPSELSPSELRPSEICHFLGGVTQKKLFIAYKVSKRESKSISVVDLDKYDFCQKWAWPPPAGGGGGEVENYSLCTSTQQY